MVVKMKLNNLLSYKLPVEFGRQNFTPSFLMQKILFFAYSKFPNFTTLHIKDVSISLLVSKFTSASDSSFSSLDLKLDSLFIFKNF